MGLAALRPDLRRASGGVVLRQLAVWWAGDACLWPGHHAFNEPDGPGGIQSPGRLQAAQVQAVEWCLDYRRRDLADHGYALFQYRRWAPSLMIQHKLM